ncbi:MAG: glycosyltransferase family 2 protein [Gemmatimonadaceae bacterium]|nr:glycosyltransferase family 2 protein [Gemmatimonadaceae bacterium]
MARVSIIVPVYYNELNLPETVPRLLALAPEFDGDDLELVFVDDGSGDASLAALQAWHAREPERVKVVALSRNFGSMAAILAGLHVASGDVIGMIAADLQDPPELFIDMHRHWRAGTKVVLAVRADREESFGQKLFANTYYGLMRRFALPGYPPGGFDFFMIDRHVADEIVRIGEKNTSLMSLIFWLGFSPVMLPYVRRARRLGRSRWTLAKKIKLFVDSFVAFSYAPIRALSAFGALMAVAAFAYGLYVLGVWATTGIPVRGFAPVIIVLAFTSGVQMLMLGILGEYLWRALDESRRRPPFVIDRQWPPVLGSRAEAALDAGSRRTVLR